MEPFSSDCTRHSIRTLGPASGSSSPPPRGFSNTSALLGLDSYCVTQLKLYTGDKLSSSIFWCLSVCQASVTPDQISTFYNIYRNTSPLLTMYHLIASSTNLSWPSTSQYRHILTQYHQVPLIIHHLVRHSSVNWIISLFMTHLMSHAQYTWSSFLFQLNQPLMYLIQLNCENHVPKSWSTNKKRHWKWSTAKVISTKKGALWIIIIHPWLRPCSPLLFWGKGNSIL